MPVAAAAPLIAEGGAVGAGAAGGAGAGAAGAGGAAGGSSLLTGAMGRFGGSALTSGSIGRLGGGGGGDKHGGGEHKQSLVQKITQPGLSAHSNAAYSAIIQPAQFH